MQIDDEPALVEKEQKIIRSAFLEREVTIDVYLPVDYNPSGLSLLLINDGQDLPKMNFGKLLHELAKSQQVRPLVCVGIYAGEDRKMEYGTAATPDFAGRGAKAPAYTRFVLEELIPFMHLQYRVETFTQVAFAGFSLGGLSALDIVWNHPGIFSLAGIFSGSLWWRSVDLEDGYNEATDRIMHQQVRKGSYHPHLRFYFTTGSLDETADRNNNGIIDSIDDTLGLIEELKQKGYSERELHYLNYEDGSHDVATWGRAMPRFLLWGWSSK